MCFWTASVHHLWSTSNKLSRNKLNAKANRKTTTTTRITKLYLGKKKNRRFLTFDGHVCCNLVLWGAQEEWMRHLSDLPPTTRTSHQLGGAARCLAARRARALPIFQRNVEIQLFKTPKSEKDVIGFAAKLTHPPANVILGTFFRTHLYKRHYFNTPMLYLLFFALTFTALKRPE